MNGERDFVVLWTSEKQTECWTEKVDFSTACMIQAHLSSFQSLDAQIVPATRTLLKELALKPKVQHAAVTRLIVPVKLHRGVFLRHPVLSFSKQENQ